jgi:hypothetical protein
MNHETLLIKMSNQRDKGTRLGKRICDSTDDEGRAVGRYVKYFLEEKPQLKTETAAKNIT